MKAGIVSIVGRPNAGKSTLINTILGSKISIVSSRPAITRIKIMGVYDSGQGQIVFLDTPGFEKIRNELGRLMLNTIISCLEESDLILFLIDARGWSDEDEKILHSIKKFNKKTILVMNKVDKVPDKTHMLPFMKEISERYEFLDVIPLSALRETNLQKLIDSIFKNLPEGEKLFPEGMETNIPAEYAIAEIIREKTVNLTYQEVPQSVAVEIEEMKHGDRNKNIWVIKANIIVDRGNLKPIIIGKDGSKLKLIGKYARKEIEDMLGTRVYLELWVRVTENWRERPDVFRKFGYGNY